jgi:hypothetical protein
MSHVTIEINGAFPNTDGREMLRLQRRSLPLVLAVIRNSIEANLAVRPRLEWPLAGTQWTKLFLDAKIGALDWQPPAADGSASFAALGDGLKWMSPPLAHETEITGPMALKLYAYRQPPTPFS